MEQTERYRDRRDAGRRLAAELAEWANGPDVIVLALPRGGVPVAYEIARALHAPLDVQIVRKLGLPGQPELAVGALASGGIRVVNQPVVAELNLSEDLIERLEREERPELERRERLYREDRPWPDLQGRTVILVDDGVATGTTMLAAIQAVRAQHPARVIVAVPVAAADILPRLGEAADRVVCPLAPESFFAISLWYEAFPQVSDAEVQALLRQPSEKV